LDLILFHDNNILIGAIVLQFKHYYVKQMALFSKETIKINNYPSIDYLDTGSITEGIIQSIEHYLDLSELPSRAKKIVKEGDIIYSTVRPNNRHYGIIQGNCDNLVVSTGFSVIRADTEKVLPKYLYYLLSMDTTIELLQTIAEQSVSTYPSINDSDIGELEYDIPSVEDQAIIVSIIDSIDCKIRLNSLVNDNLLAILNTEYNKIKSEYPADSELSDICTLNNQRRLASELTPSNYYSTENMLPNKGGVVPASSMPSDNKAIICEVGDVLISNIRPYFKKIHYCFESSGCSADVLDFRAKNVQHASYLYGILYSDDFFDYVVAGSKGTKMPRGDKDQIMQYSIPLPPEVVLDAYCELGQLILSQVTSNNQESAKLVALRDFILPKLMSGEIDVSTLEIPN